MILARIDGHATVAVGHPSLKGQTLVICTPVGPDGKNAGAPFVAIDPMNAGIHATVYITTDGSHTQMLTGDPKSPIRNQVMGILDAA